MFVSYFTDLAVPADLARAAILEAPEAWVPDLARDASARGERLLVELGFDVAATRFGREAVIRIDPPVHLGEKTTIPMRWSPTKPDSMIPVFEADLEIAPWGPGTTQLALSVRYRPPLGRVGNAIDRAVMHRVAEAIVKDFLDRVRETVLVSSTLTAIP